MVHFLLHLIWLSAQEHVWLLQNSPFQICQWATMHHETTKLCGFSFSNCHNRCRARWEGLATRLTHSKGIAYCFAIMGSAFHKETILDLCQKWLQFVVLFELWAVHVSGGMVKLIGLGAGWFNLNHLGLLKNFHVWISLCCFPTLQGFRNQKAFVLHVFWIDKEVINGQQIGKSQQEPFFATKQSRVQLLYISKVRLPGPFQLFQLCDVFGRGLPHLLRLAGDDAADVCVSQGRLRRVRWGCPVEAPDPREEDLEWQPRRVAGWAAHSLVEARQNQREAGMPAHQIQVEDLVGSQTAVCALALLEGGWAWWPSYADSLPSLRYNPLAERQQFVDHASLCCYLARGKTLAG